MSEKSFHGVRGCRHPFLRLASLCILLIQAGCGSFDLFEKKVQTNPTTYGKQKEVVTDAERPATPKTMYAYARILAAQGKDPACDQLLSKVIEASPRSKDAYILQAEIRVRMRRVADAIQTLKAALPYMPRNDVILNNLGMCLMMKSDCAAALASFTQAAASRPANARYRANMAMALGLLGREEESSSLYNMVVSSEDSAHNIAVLNSARGKRLGLHITPVDPRSQAAPPTRVRPASNDQPAPSPVSLIEENGDHTYSSLITDAAEPSRDLEDSPEYPIIQP